MCRNAIWYKLCRIFFFYDNTLPSVERLRVHLFSTMEIFKKEKRVTLEKLKRISLKMKKFLSKLYSFVRINLQRKLLF